MSKSHCAKWRRFFGIGPIPVPDPPTTVKRTFAIVAPPASHLHHRHQVPCNSHGVRNTVPQWLPPTRSHHGTPSPDMGVRRWPGRPTESVTPSPSHHDRTHRDWQSLGQWQTRRLRVIADASDHPIRLGATECTQCAALCYSVWWPVTFDNRIPVAAFKLIKHFSPARAAKPFRSSRMYHIMMPGPSCMPSVISEVRVSIELCQWHTSVTKVAGSTVTASPASCFLQIQSSTTWTWSSAVVCPGPTQQWCALDRRAVSGHAWPLWTEMAGGARRRRQWVSRGWSPLSAQCSASHWHWQCVLVVQRQMQ